MVRRLDCGAENVLEDEFDQLTVGLGVRDGKNVTGWTQSCSATRLKGHALRLEIWSKIELGLKRWFDMSSTKKASGNWWGQNVALRNWTLSGRV